MKKVFLIFLVVFLMYSIGCDKSSYYNDILQKALDEINISQEITDDLELVETVNINDEIIIISYEFSKPCINELGVISRSSFDEIVEARIKASLNGHEKIKTITVTVLKETIIDNIDYDELIKEALESIYIPHFVYSNIEIKNEIIYKDKKIFVSYDFKTDLITSNGSVIFPKEESKTVQIELTGMCLEHSFKITKDVLIPCPKDLFKNAKSKINVPKEIDTDIEFISYFEGVYIEWYSDNTYILSQTGRVRRVNEITPVNITADMYCIIDGIEIYNEEIIEYNVFVVPYSLDKVLEELINSSEIVIPNEVCFDLYLPTRLEDLNIDLTWESSDEQVLSNYGKVTLGDTLKDVTLKVSLSREDENFSHYFNITVLSYKTLESDTINFYSHNYIERINDFDTNRLNNLIIDNDSLVIVDGKVEGSYESKIIKCLDIKSLVASWSCITGVDYTIELKVRVRVDGIFTDYMTYGVFGLGKPNYYYNQTVKGAYMDVDQIFISGKECDAFQFLVTLRREDESTKSPRLHLVCVCLDIKNKDYHSAIDSKLLKDKVDYDLPKLYQHDVPNIGGSICSPTTTTMLLKYKGHSFTDKGYNYEHEYIAKLVADPGHNSPTYGNWVYNMAVAGAFGEIAYVNRMYSFEELMYHLDQVGPVGTTIRGNFGKYTTGGHLIVVRGYRIIDNKTTVICNDPNVSGVYYEVSLETFMNCWSKIQYIVE